MKKITILTILIFSISGSVNAQFLKKLGKKIERAAEKTVERRAERKTEKETNKAIDKVFDKKKKDKKKKKKRFGIPSISQAEPAKNYSFNHQAQIEFKNGKEVINIDYHLPEKGNFLCAQIKDEKIKDDFFTVFDIDREAMFSYMENEGKKTKIGVDFKLEETDTDKNSMTITPTGNTKKILGYNCLEYNITGEDMRATIWVTKEVDIRFPSTFYSVKQNKNNNQKWMKDLDGWAMEMKMIDTSKRKPQTIIMNCLSIEKSDLKINSNEYLNIGY